MLLEDFNIEVLNNTQKTIGLDELKKEFGDDNPCKLRNVEVSISDGNINFRYIIYAQGSDYEYNMYNMSFNINNYTFTVEDGHNQEYRVYENDKFNEKAHISSFFRIPKRANGALLDIYFKGYKDGECIDEMEIVGIIATFQGCSFILVEDTEMYKYTNDKPNITIERLNLHINAYYYSNIPIITFGAKHFIRTKSARQLVHSHQEGTARLI